ncbi:GyrI-like domain-containing protein [Aquimarina sp. 2-A2]|uniref:GyrI-like domain-containing protein n=1 Tax=Aquimarina sp. 2-A2 TaxID=3382644 RepID=UPI00387F229A
MSTPEIQEIQEKRLLGRLLLTTPGAPEVQMHWKTFVTDIIQHLGIKPSEFYAVHEYDAEFSETGVYKTWATILDDVQYSKLKDVSEVVIEKGLYAIFTHHGPTKTFHRTLSYIHNEWLPSSGYVIDERRHFDYMGPKYLGPENPLSEEQIYIPIKKVTPQ